MIDTIGYSRNSSNVISEILVAYIPKAEQGPRGGVEDRSFAGAAGSAVSVSGSRRDIGVLSLTTSAKRWSLDMVLWDWRRETYRLSTHPTYMNGGCCF